MGKKLKSAKTRKELKKVFLDLFESLPPDKISVNKLTQTCGINRKTFYYHFDDMYDFLIWVLRDDYQQEMENWGIIDTMQEYFDFLFTYLEKYENRIRLLSTYVGRPRMKKGFQKDCHRIVSRMIEVVEKREQVTVSEQYRKFLVRFYASAMASSLYDWLHGKERACAREEADYLTVTMKQSLQGTFSSLPGIEKGWLKKEAPTDESCGQDNKQESLLPFPGTL
ncbi:MAG: TetR/AcrR family transcriptional regulator C-terminal domain-containing protein [Lachnospiraceae bacterium]|nr:TetR/AcrR family transcriptional regulator C-terminal domain-containing protein [Lachnospiraceae bacterium]